MSEPLVSVVIPAYNYGQFVTEAVDCALAQSYPNVEVIVVDDGSTDDTRRRLEPYGARIRYHYQKNQGLSAARNTGIRLARGEFIALLDADDLWHPRKLEVQMRVFARHPDAAVVASDGKKDLGVPWCAINDDAPLAEEEIPLTDLLIHSRFGPSGVVLRRACLGEETPFDTTLRSVEDRDLWMRLAARFPIIRVNLPLMHYRVHGGQMSLAAERMEHYERLVVARAFRTLPVLRGRWLLRAKITSFVDLWAALRYRDAGCYGTSLRRFARAMLVWPWPYARTETKFLLMRPKGFLVTLSRWLFHPAAPAAAPVTPREPRSYLPDRAVHLTATPPRTDA
jgi:glycosyltransferase involved in cell wall biosynthesis